MPSLWLLTQDYVDAMDAIGESANPEEDFLALEAIQATFEQKAENVGKYILSLNAEAKMVKDEEARLRERRGVIERQAKRLKDYLYESLTNAGRDKVEGDVLTVSLRKCAMSCEIIDVALVPEGFKDVVETVKCDKAAMKQQYKADGVPIPGAEMVTGKTTVQIK